MTVDTWGPWNDQVPVILLTPDQARAVMVPQDDRRKILDALRQRYEKAPRPEFEPTEENVKAWYLRGTSRAAGLIDGR